MNKKLFEEYRDIKTKMSELEKRAKEMAPLIVEEMKTNGADKIKLEDGTGVFSLNSRRSWKYSKHVTDAEESLKQLMAQEQADGTATSTEVKLLVFSAPKKDE